MGVVGREAEHVGAELFEGNVFSGDWLALTGGPTRRVSRAFEKICHALSKSDAYSDDTGALVDTTTSGKSKLAVDITHGLSRVGRGT